MPAPSHRPKAKRIVSFRARTTLKMGLQPACFGNSQHMKPVNYSRPNRAQKPDRDRRGKEVERLLQLRRQILQDARQRGDFGEVERLLNLGLFDNILPPDDPPPKSLERTRRREKPPVREIPSLKAMNSDCNLCKPLPSLPSIDSSTTVASIESDSDDTSEEETNSTQTPVTSPPPSPHSLPKPALEPFAPFVKIALEDEQSSPKSEPSSPAEEPFDPFLEIALEEQALEAEARYLRRFHRRQSSRDITTFSRWSSPSPPSPSHPYTSGPSSPTPSSPSSRESSSSTSASSTSTSLRSPPSPTLNMLRDRVRSLSQSPIIMQMIRDLDLLADHKAGLYEPGDPEIRMIEERVKVLERSAVVEELEGALAGLRKRGGGW